MLPVLEVHVRSVLLAGPGDRVASCDPLPGTDKCRGAVTVNEGGTIVEPKLDAASSADAAQAVDAVEGRAACVLGPCSHVGSGARNLPVGDCEQCRTERYADVDASVLAAVQAVLRTIAVQFAVSRSAEFECHGGWHAAPDDAC
jgi:hypothetical protein